MTSVILLYLFKCRIETLNPDIMLQFRYPWVVMGDKGGEIWRAARKNGSWTLDDKKEVLNIGDTITIPATSETRLVEII